MGTYVISHLANMGECLEMLLVTSENVRCEYAITHSQYMERYMSERAHNVEVERDLGSGHAV
jgi:hypothetical protein